MNITDNTDEPIQGPLWSDIHAGDVFRVRQSRSALWSVWMLRTAESSCVTHVDIENGDTFVQEVLPAYMFEKADAEVALTRS